ncbi:MAG: bifunctional adenosylcobinamide kinase/adenosylcobinamide-phosphate guanylyltransferase [Eubacteriales bacterium]|jgi:adenosylcobinamide kinase/adenosylcobinamide-phosphate guanylyltransferase|nr:bifunctional adenosylcobinamide kinase/adenosylcobinamide-phosphate guanylyltransferase [Eubacteriales bacterium]
MNIFISGGCKNGKSYFAQELARKMSVEQCVELYYIATMIPVDDEDRARIKRHLHERDGWGFETIEQGVDICQALKENINPKGAFLLDSVTALLSNEMFKKDGTIDLKAGERVAEELVEFARKTGNTVFVSDYIYSDGRNFDEYTETYRKALAKIDRELANICDQVIEVTFGNRYYFK